MSKWFKRDQPTSHDSDGPVLLPAPVTVVEVGHERSAVMNQLSRRVDWVPTYLVELAKSSAISGTASQVVEQLRSSGLEEEYPGAFAHAVENMCRHQLLVEDVVLSEMLHAELDGALERRERPIDASVWCTRNRPQELLRSIASQYKAQRETGRGVTEYWCFDDEDGDVVRTAVDAERQRSRHSVLPSLRLVARTEKAKLVDALCQSCGPSLRRIVNFGLLASDSGWGSSLGANRNSSLVFMAGRRFSALDDDMTCRGFSDDSFDGIAVDGTVEPVRRLGDETGRPSSASCSPSGHIDPVALHQQLLGVTAQEVLSRHSKKQLLRVSRSLVTALAANAKIVMSSIGYYGMIASHPAEILAIHERYQTDFSVGASEYRRVRQAHEITEYVPHRTITNNSRIVACAFALDQTELMPPFAPLGRRQDAVFSMLVTGLWKDRLIGHIPAAMEHKASVERSVVAESITEVAYSANDMLMMVIRLFEPNKVIGARAEQMMRLGRFLIALCDEETNGRSMVVEAFRAGFRQHLANLISSRNRFRDSPDDWLRDVDARIVSLETVLSADRIIPPIEYTSAIGTIDWIPRFRQYVRDYGELVYHWPEIWEAARELREAGKLDFSVI